MSSVSRSLSGVARSDLAARRRVPLEGPFFLFPFCQPKSSILPVTYQTARWRTGFFITLRFGGR